MATSPTSFKNPHSIRNRVGRLAWLVVWHTLFRTSPRLPHFFDGWRRFLLLCFGASIKSNCVISPRVRIWAPWLLEIGTGGSLDNDVYLYNPHGIRIGDRVVISYGSQLVSASHDHTEPDYPLIGATIIVEDDAWIAAEAFIGPGTRISVGCVIGARAVVVRSTEPWGVYAGNPARRVKERTLRTRSAT